MSTLRDYLRENYVFEHEPISPPPFPQLTSPCYMHVNKKQNVDLSWWAITEPFVMEAEPFRHDFDQWLFFSGSGTSMNELGGIIEFHLGDEHGNMETFTVTKPTTFYVKAGHYHCPIIFKEVFDPKRPMFFCDVSMAGIYRKYKLGSDQPLGVFDIQLEKTW